MSENREENVGSTKPHAYRGADSRLESRPGVPRDAAPHPLPGAHWTVPEQQPIEQMLHFRSDREKDTAVFSTALPPRGLSGLIRRVAHRIPEDRVSHWMLLLAADRIDVIQSLPRSLARRAVGESSLKAGLERPRIGQW
jgi:hypothetical protein